MDFQDLLRGADRHQHLEHRHGGVRCGAECGQSVGGGHHLGRRHRHFRRGGQSGDPACRLERGRPAGAVVPECVRGAVYADSFHLYLPGDLRQND